jgi:hypothetical protein
MVARVTYPYPSFGYDVPTPDPSDALKRPGVVTTASWFLYASAASLVTLLITAVYDVANYSVWADAAGARLGTSASDLAADKAQNQQSDIIELVVFGLLGVLLVAAAVLVRRRIRIGQILAYAAAGVTILCCGISLVAGLATSDDATSKLDDAIYSAQPTWMNILPAGAVLAFPLAITALVLLLLGSARRWFSGRPAVPGGFMYVPASQFPGAPTYPYQPGYAYPAPEQWVAPSYPPYPGSTLPEPPPGMPPVPPTFPAYPTSPYSGIYPTPPDFPPPPDPTLPTPPSATPDTTEKPDSPPQD